MKKTTYILFFLATLTGVWFYFFNPNVLATYKSPDGKYELLVTDDTPLLGMSMPGQGGLGSRSVQVILKDSNGHTIGKSSSNNSCGVLYDSIEVEWDLKNNQVWYGRAKTINLKTGKVEC